MISPQKARQTDNAPDSVHRTGDSGLYAVPTLDIDPQYAATYHRIDVPGLEDKKWQWDLRGQERSYLGNYDFNGKRVLEFGAANGGLTFWMEQQGADVVAVDLSPDVAETSWDILVGPEDNLRDIRHLMARGIRRLNNGFWYAHEQLGSKARLVHGTAYQVPNEIGRFDVVTLGSILIHLRDPLRALENAISLTERSVIITDVVPRVIAEHLQPLPLAYFMPEKSRRVPHGGWTWWHITAEVYVRFLTLKGFRIISNTTDSYKHKLGPRTLYTLVAERV
jgi:SAM-dependent methyltransferase